MNYLKTSKWKWLLAFMLIVHFFIYDRITSLTDAEMQEIANRKAVYGLKNASVEPLSIQIDGNDSTAYTYSFSDGSYTRAIIVVDRKGYSDFAAVY